MSYCLTSGCLKPFNSNNAKFCLACGSRLLLGDRYRALQPIGTGQASRTFLGIDSRRIVDNRCIIKAFSARHGVEAFRVEAERLEQVRQHSQLPDLLAYFERGETIYLVQEFVDGLSLQQTLKTQGSLTEDQIRQLLIETLPLLKFLHDRHIIHRDLKPSNLIRRRTDGVLMLVDIGSAKYATATSLNKTGTLVGSAEYAPLEQLMGRAVFASDLYSLGVTCVHLLTGLSPFELFNPTDGRWLWRSVSGPVSSQIETVLNGLVARDVSQRYGSVDQVWLDLDPEMGADLGADLGKHLGDTNYTQASQRPSASIPVQIPPIKTNSVAEPTHPTWIREQVLSHDGGINALALTPDGRILATGGNDARICLWDVASGLCVYSLEDHALAISALAISADGRTLASSSWDQTLRLWDLQSATPQQQMQATQREVTALALAGLGVAPNLQSPEQSILISAGRDAVLNLWNITTGKAIAQLKDHNKAIEAIALATHQPLLASGDAEGRVNIWHLGTYERLRTLSKHQASVNAIAIRADREAIATGSADTTVRLRQLNTGGGLHVLKGHTLPIAALAFCPDLPYLASGSYDGSVRIWHLETGDCVQILREHSQPIVAIAFTTQNTLISTSRDGAIYIWRCSSE